MAVSVAIDSFRLSCDPLTSNCVYITELVNSFEENSQIDRIYLLIPYKPDESFRYHFLAENSKVTFVYPKNPQDPNKHWLAQTWWIQGGVLGCLKSIDYKIDFLISPYHQVPVFLPKRIKSLVVIHDICGLDTFLYPRLKKGYYKHYFNFIMSIIRADIFVPISEFTKKEFVRKFPFLEKKISRVVYNNISSEIIGEQLMIDTLNKHQLNFQSYFFCLGAMTPRKGIDLMIPAFKKYQEKGGKASFMFVVGKNQVKDIEVMFKAADVKNVKVITGITNEERDSFYRGALALVFPSRCEGFGFPILEAMVQGCPPIAWIKSPALEIMGESENFLQVLSADAITEQLFKYDSLKREEREILSHRLKERAQTFMGNNFGKSFYEAMVENPNVVK